MAGAAQTQYESIISSAPSSDFRTAVDTSRLTRAVGVQTVAGATTWGIAVRNPVTNAMVTFSGDIVILPVRTQQTVTVEAAYSVIYFY